MGRTGYECQNCGYEPDENELASGGCPGCSESRRGVWKTLPGELEKLPIGSTFQVLERRVWWTGVWNKPQVRHQRDDTLYLWTLVERDANGAVWRGAKGVTTFLDADGLERTVYVSDLPGVRLTDTDPLRMRSEAVAFCTVWKMTYGAWYVIHDATVTDRRLALQRLRDDMGWPVARAA